MTTRAPAQLTSSVKRGEEEEEDVEEDGGGRGEATAAGRVDYTLCDFHVVHCDVNDMFGLF